MYLSKSQYRRSIECPRYIRLKEEKDIPCEEEFNKTIIEIGNQVGEAARRYFVPDYPQRLMISREQSNAEMVAKTKEQLEAGEEYIFEASFNYNGCFCSVDVLRRMKNGYRIIEVKASTDKSEEKGEDGEKTGTFKKKDPKGIDLYDMAYQYHVLTNCGINVTDVILMRLNGEFRCTGKMNDKKVFALDKCTKDVKQLLDIVKRDTIGMKAFKALSLDQASKLVPVGEQCPCGYWHWCEKNDMLPKPNSFGIGFGRQGGSFTKAKAKAKAKDLTFERILEEADNLGLNEAQKNQVYVHLNPGKSPIINKDAIQQFLGIFEDNYPVYHLDFETFQQGIPTYKGVRAYEQIPFQFSIHIQRKKGDKVEDTEHISCLAKESDDPAAEFNLDSRQEIALGLYEALKELRETGKGVIMAYNADFERTVLKSLADWFDGEKDFPEDMCKFFADIADKRTGRMVDLMEVFENGHYYHADMRGSYSIKAVLPAVLGYNPYDSLKGIKHGGDAMDMFPKLHKQGDKIAEIRSDLLAYCNLDTEAMVLLLNKLYELA